MTAQSFHEDEFWAGVAARPRTWLFAMRYGVCDACEAQQRTDDRRDRESRCALPLTTAVPKVGPDFPAVGAVLLAGWVGAA